MKFRKEYKSTMKQLINDPFFYSYIVFTLLFSVCLIPGIVVLILLIRLNIRKRTTGAFHIENGVLYTHEIISKKILIAEIKNIRIDYSIFRGRKYIIRITTIHNKTAGIMITHNIDDEFKRFKKELKENGYEIKDN